MLMSAPNAAPLTPALSPQSGVRESSYRGPTSLLRHSLEGEDPGERDFLVKVCWSVSHWETDICEFRFFEIRLRSVG